MGYRIAVRQQRGDPFIGALIGLGAKILPKIGGVVSKVLGKGKLPAFPGGSKLPAVLKGAAGVAGGVASGVAGSLIAERLTSGGGRKKNRRMNVGNARAATRAIRRIKGARDLLRKIESQMPKQRCGCGTKARRRAA